MIVSPVRAAREKNYPEILAATLNGQYSRSSLGRLAGIPRDRLLPNVQNFCNPSRETRDAAVQEFLSTLKRLAEQWIASGKDERDPLREQPWSRNVLWFSDAYQEPIHITQRKFLSRNPPPILPYSDGRLTIASHLWLPAPTAWPFPEPKLEDTLARARDLAIYEFQQFLGSDCPQRLFRCNKCNRYFALTRKPREVIQRGAFCKRCKSAGRVRGIQIRRTTQKEKLWNVAAEAWVQFKRTHANPDQKEWVRRQVSKKCGVNFQLKWVTRNLTEILARVEALKDAKG